MKFIGIHPVFIKEGNHINEKEYNENGLKAGVQFSKENILDGPIMIGEKIEENADYTMMEDYNKEIVDICSKIIEVGIYKLIEYTKLKGIPKAKMMLKNILKKETKAENLIREKDSKVRNLVLITNKKNDKNEIERDLKIG